MKRITQALIMFFTITTLAQSSGINYKAVVKDGSGNIVANQVIGAQFTVFEDAVISYVETHESTTDANGIIILNIGQGTAITSTFDAIDWTKLTTLKTEIDINGGLDNLVDMGTTAFNAVPYALTAKTAENVTGLETIDEGNGPGLVRVGRVAADYGNVGLNAVDLSIGASENSNGATGPNSTAMGFDTTASGDWSTAMGGSTTASGDLSTATGFFTEASEFASTAMGAFTTASGNSSTAMGNSATASGDLSTAMGDNTTASAYASIAMGLETTASGEVSIAMGLETTASGEASTAMGLETTASGEASTAMGQGTLAEAQYSTAIGLNNVGGGSPTTNVPSDPLFEVGNGTDIANRSNALTILKNGTITAPSLSNALINIAGDKALITKEYADDLIANRNGAIDALVQLPLTGGIYENYGSDFEDAAYYRNNDRVYLEGLVRKLNSSSQLIGTLPVGYRPSGKLIFIAASDVANLRIDIYPNGEIIQFSTTTPNFISLSGISFRAAD